MKISERALHGMAMVSLQANNVWVDLTQEEMSEMSDVDILQYALTLEHMEAAMYESMVAANIVTGKEQEYFRSMGEHEASHVSALMKALQAEGVEPVAALMDYHFPAFDSREAILDFAKSAEETGVGAYQGVLAEIDSKDYLAAASSI